MKTPILRTIVFFQVRISIFSIVMFHFNSRLSFPPRDQMDNKTIKEVILHDKECPLSICLDHAQKNEGTNNKPIFHI